MTEFTKYLNLNTVIPCLATIKEGCKPNSRKLKIITLFPGETTGCLEHLPFRTMPRRKPHTTQVSLASGQRANSDLTKFSEKLSTSQGWWHLCPSSPNFSNTSISPTSLAQKICCIFLIQMHSVPCFIHNYSCA